MLFVFVFSVTSIKAQYTFVGNSSALGNNCYQVTPNQLWQNGAIWYNDEIDLNNAFHLQFEASWGNNPAGADGMVFVMQQVGNTAIGLDGGGIGFEGFSPSFGVEFDTWPNLDFGDPTYDHIAFLQNGNVNHNSPDNLAGPVQAQAASTTLSDGLYHVVDIFWDPADNSIEVWMDCEPRLTATIDLIGDIFNNTSNVFWGFTGATGGESNAHRVCLDPLILGLPESYTLCQGEELQLEATGAAGGTYTWEPANLVSNPNISNPTTSPDETTEFTVTFSDLCGTEQVQSTVVNVVNPIAELGPDAEACIGAEFTIEPVNSFGDLSWSDGSTGPSLTVTASGTYTLTATADGCEATDEITVTFTENPELTLPDEATICQGESFTVDLSDSGLDIAWADAPGEGAVRTFTTAGTFYVTGSLGTCLVEDSITIGVTPLPNFNLGADIEACEGQSVLLEVVSQGAAVTWNTGASGSTLEVFTTGFYEATATANGCSSTDGINVLFLESPQPAIIGITAFCENEGTTLTATGGTSYLWSNGSTDAQITTSQSGNLSVHVTNDNTGCSNTATVRLVAQPLPGITLAENILKCIDESVQLNPVITGSSTVQWSTGAIASSISVTQPGEYTATASNNCGEIMARVEVVDEECFQNLFIPNAFTPNGDGINDLFGVQGEGILRFKMQIYDRWSSLVFETNDINAFWNGSYQNSSYYCEAGIYMVRIELEYENKELKVQVGHVNLLR